MPAPIAVFDLDGTLVDTAPDLIDTLNFILRREGLTPVAYDEARTMIGGGARAMLERGLGARGEPVPAGEHERLFADFIAHYSAHIADRSRPFPGVEDALEALAQSGFVLAVCTNKLEWLSRKLLDTLRLTDRFAAICGQDTFGVQKPNPLVWRKTIAAAQGDAARAVMIGDSGTDVALARAAGVPVIAVDFGYTERPIETFRPDRTISHFDRLVPAIHDVIASNPPTRKDNPVKP